MGSGNFSDFKFVEYGWDDASHCDYLVIMKAESEEAAEPVNGGLGLHVQFKYRFREANNNNNGNLSIYDLHFSGQISRQVHKVALGPLIDLRGFPLRAREDAIYFVFSLYELVEPIQAHLRVYVYDHVPPVQADLVEDIFLGLDPVVFDEDLWEMPEADSFGRKPASRKAVRALEKVYVGGETGTICPVCLSGFKSPDICILPGSFGLRMPCSHDFHTCCLLDWLERTNSCPMCRFELETYP